MDVVVISSDREDVWGVLGEVRSVPCSGLD